ncbi:MAG: hypothetical protein JWL63_2904 [Rhodocyclales bacterium]|nr:hypothetical protein [Rhodocyclales bacterium]
MSLLSTRIEASCCRHFTETLDAPSAPWVESYYKGLLTPFGLDLDTRQLKEGKNNDFMTMAFAVMQALMVDSPLDDVGLFLMAHQTLDTYFPFRSTTTRLCRQFGIEAPAVALTEHELTSPYVALKVLLTALKQETFVGSGLLLVLDQATQPYKGTWDPAQSIDTALAIKLAKTLGDDGVCVSGHYYWTEKAHKASWIVQCIYSCLDARRCDMADVHIVAEQAVAQDIGMEVKTAQLSITDPRFMSCGGLMAAVALLNSGTERVLLVHLSTDGHLYLFMFQQTNGQAGSVDRITCSI